MPSVVKSDEPADNINSARQTTNTSPPSRNNEMAKNCPFTAAKAKEEKIIEKDNKGDSRESGNKYFS